MCRIRSIPCCGRRCAVVPDGSIPDARQVLTKFAIDGYSQAEHEWYERNTLVSATVSLTMMNIVDNMGFVMAVDAIQTVS